MKKTIYTFIISCLVTAFFPVYAQPGSLDLTFSSDGKLTTDFIGAADGGAAVAIQSDGKIIVAGNSSSGSNADFALVRYNTDGSLDISFGTTGKITTAIGTGNDFGLSIAIQTDGKIVVAGFSDNGTNADFALVRYNTNGSLDNLFDTDGKVTTAIGSADDRGYSVAIQSDGKIVVAGVSVNGGTEDFALVRYNTNGSLDTSFDSDGKITTDFSGGNDDGLSVAIQNDGKIVVGGYSSNSTDTDFALVRYTTNGSLDTSFDTDGKVSLDINSYDFGRSIALQSDGKILLTGWSNSPYDYTMVRYNTTGVLDNTFGTGGIVNTDFASTNDSPYSIAIQSNGKIVVAGQSGTSPTRDFALVRYNTDGSLDTSFDSDGKVTTDFGGDDNGTSVAIQSDGKIVVLGRSTDDFSVARYDGDPIVICNVTVYDTISVTDTLIINAVLTGVNPPSNINALKIYPNPANTHIVIDNGNISSMIGYTIRIDNTLGQTVFQSLITQQLFNIDLSGWSGNGTYFVYIIDSGSNTVDVKKILLQ